MTVSDIAKDFVALYNQGKVEEIGRTYWADSVVSIEPMQGPMARLEGRDAVQGKSDWWYANHTVYSSVSSRPHINGDQFCVIFQSDILSKQSGERMQMEEIGLYTIKDGKIIEERFFY